MALEALRASARDLTLADVGEKRLLREFLFPLYNAVLHSNALGDDGGIVSVACPRDLVMSTDRVPTDLLPRQFGLMSAEQFGRYLVRVNVSDLVAMGATPLALVVTTAYPASTRVAYVLEMMFGCYSESAALGAPAIGGDTKAAAEESVSASAIGTVAPGKALLRGPISPGDQICVTGMVGRAGAALHWFGASKEIRHEVASSVGIGPAAVAELARAIVSPDPRLDLLHKLRDDEAITGCMDVTDGLGQSLEEMAMASQVEIVIDSDYVPVDPLAKQVARALDMDPFALVGGIGIDLELLIARSADATPVPWATVIGRVADGIGVTLRRSDGSLSRFPCPGFEHFRGTPADLVTTRANRDQGQ